jgi:Transposase
VTSGAESDPGDAKVLADLVRIDRHNHRRVAGDSALAEAIKILARAHQRLIWTRRWSWPRPRSMRHTSSMFLVPADWPVVQNPHRWCEPC